MTFRAVCPPCVEHPDDSLTFTDPALFEAHHETVHPGRVKARDKRLRESMTYRPFQAWRPPGRRAYAPKPLDAGQPITFTERRDGEDVERPGVIWSDGPVTNSLWVLPDDAPGDPVAVRVSGHRAVRFRAMHEYPATWQRDTVKRCDNVRPHGGIFAVDQEREPWRVVWHADPDCPFARGKKPATVNAGYGSRGEEPRVPIPRKRAHDVVDALLLSATNRDVRGYIGKLCRRCVWGDEATEATA